MVEVMRGIQLEDVEGEGRRVQIGKWVDGKVKRFQVNTTRIVMLGGAAAASGP